MNPDITSYSQKLESEDGKIATLLSEEICKYLPETENKIWHAHPVWFLDGNPIVGYSKQKRGIRLMFWSGKSFNGRKTECGRRKISGCFYFL